MAKATEALVESRVKTVYEMLLYGSTRTEILQYASEWGLTERSMDTYIAKATERLLEHSKSSQEAELSRVLSHHWRLFKDAEKEKDRAEMRKVLEAVSKIRGLDQLNLNVKFDRPLKEVSDEDLASKLLGEKE